MGRGDLIREDKERLRARCTGRQIAEKAFGLDSRRPY